MSQHRAPGAPLELQGGMGTGRGKGKGIGKEKGNWKDKWGTGRGKGDLQGDRETGRERGTGRGKGNWKGKGELKGKRNWQGKGDLTEKGTGTGQGNCKINSRKNDHEAKTYRFGTSLEPFWLHLGPGRSFGAFLGFMGLSQHKAILSHLGTNLKPPGSNISQPEPT